MQLTFLGATKTVTGSKYLITINSKNTSNSKNILIDCGLFQGFKSLRTKNWSKLPINPSAIDAVILTHAHIDHSGYLPVLIKNGFKGKIYCSYGTRDLCAILLPDSGHIQEEDANRANRYGYSRHKPALPLYTKEDGLRALDQFYPINFNETFSLFADTSFTLFSAGHIIGSSLIEFKSENKSLLFTGDLGRPNDQIMKPPTNISATDYLIIESTYGDRLHGQQNPIDQLATNIQETIAKGGSVIIPAFAVGRTQDILYFIYLLKKTNRIPDVPVFLDSPMAEDVSDLMIHYSNEHRLTKEECKQICKIATYIKTPEESKSIDQCSYPVIIISASGMLEGGRILHHLKVFLPDHRHTVLLTGYQAQGTRGSLLLHGRSEIKIHGETVPVRAKIVEMSNMSAHADYQEILQWLHNFKQQPKKVFLIHGDKESSSSLKTKIENEFAWNCLVPDYLHTENL